MKPVWDKPNPVKHSDKLSPAQKAKAKARARAAGRPYPNMVDNIWAARNEQMVNPYTELIEKIEDMCNVCGQTPCNCTHIEEAKATPCGRCGTTHVAPKFGGTCPALKEGAGAYMAAVAAMPAAAYLGAKLGNKLADYQDKKRKEKAKADLAAVKTRRAAKKQSVNEISKELANRYYWSAKSSGDEMDKKISSKVKKLGDKWSQRTHNNLTNLLAKSQKRTAGRLRALDRLNKEEVERIAEMDSQGYTGTRDKVSMSTYGSRDRNQPSVGVDRYGKAIPAKQVIKKGAAELAKSMSAAYNKDKAVKEEHLVEFLPALLGVLGRGAAVLGRGAATAGRGAATAGRGAATAGRRIGTGIGVGSVIKGIGSGVGDVIKGVGSAVGSVANALKGDSDDGEDSSVKKNKKMTVSNTEYVKEATSARLRLASALQRERERRELKDKARAAREAAAKPVSFTNYTQTKGNNDEKTN